MAKKTLRRLSGHGSPIAIGESEAEVKRSRHAGAADACFRDMSKRIK